MDDSTTALLGIYVTVLLAGGGWLFAYLSKRRHDARAAQLERVNRQLRELYGPLYIGLLAGQRTWEAFWKKYRPAHGQEYFFGPTVEVTDAEKAVWRNWVANVFGPMNAKAEDIITSNIDLLESDEVPEAFVDALAHVAAYRATLAQWELGDFSEHASVNNWPREELIELVRHTYETLRSRQRELLDA